MRTESAWRKLLSGTIYSTWIATRSPGSEMKKRAGTIVGKSPNYVSVALV